MRKAIFDNKSPEAEKAVELVRGAIKGRLVNLGREIPEEAGKLGKFNIDLLKQADFDKFYKENQTLINEFFDKGDVEMFANIPKLMSTLQKEITANQKFINSLKGNKQLRDLGLTFDDVDGATITSQPEWFFNHIWTSQGGVGSITRIEKFIRAIPSNKVGGWWCG